MNETENESALNLKKQAVKKNVKNKYLDLKKLGG